jgi:hypothetical protein
MTLEDPHADNGEVDDEGTDDLWREDVDVLLDAVDRDAKEILRRWGASAEIGESLWGLDALDDDAGATVARQDEGASDDGRAGLRDVQVRRAVLAIVLVRDARLHRDDGNINRAMWSALQALVRSGIRASGDLLRQNRSQGAHAANTKKREGAVLRDARIRDHDADSRRLHPDWSADNAQAHGVSERTIRRALRQNVTRA